MLYVLRFMRQYLKRSIKKLNEIKRTILCMFVFIIPVVFPPDIFAKTEGVDYQNDGEEFAKDLVKKIKGEDLKDVLEKKDGLKSPKGEAVEGEGCNNCVQNIENPESLVKRIEAEMGGRKEEILVFVSFSMPELSLKELSKEAGKHNAKLILRGLYRESFRKTAEKILEIDKKGMGLEIDPKLFKKYQIKQVPTFVLIEGEKEIGRLSGNVTLEYAKTELEKE